MSDFCKEAIQFSHKWQYGEASWKQRWQLRFHLLICKACAGFSRKNRKLTQLCEHARLQQLTDTQKQEMKKQLLDQGR